MNSKIVFFSYRKNFFQSNKILTKNKTMKVFWLFLYFLYANYVSGMADKDQIEQQLQQQQENDPAQKIDKIKKAFCAQERLNSRLNKTNEIPEFHESAQMKYERVDIRLVLSKKIEYLGNKIKTDFDHNVTSDGKFFVRATTDIYNREEKYNLNIDGMIKGKTVNETGKLTLHWDKVGFTFETDADQISTDFNKIALFFDCVNPTLKIEGLEILDQIEKERLYTEIFNMVLESWTRELMMGKIPMERKNMESCIRKN